MPKVSVDWVKCNGVVHVLITVLLPSLSFNAFKIIPIHRNQFQSEQTAASSA
jgi:hypothetical protein